MEGLNRRHLLRLFAGVGAAGLTGGLTACAADLIESPKSAVRIGLLLPTTGVNKAIGTDLENGFRLFLKQNNNQLGGHPVDVVVQDEGDNPEVGLKALEALHGQNVAAVVGAVQPDLLLAVRQSVEKSQVPLIATHSSPSQARMSSSVWIWRTGFLSDEPGRVAGKYLRGEGVARVGLQNNFGLDVMQGFAEEHGNALAPTWVPPENPSPASVGDAINATLASGATAVFSTLPTMYLKPYWEELRVANPALKIYTPGLVTEGPALDLLQLTGTSNLFTVCQYSPDLTNAANRLFSAAFQTEFSRSPTMFAVTAHDAAFVLDRAISLIGDDTVSPQRLNLEIGNVGQVISPRGNWQFTQARSPQQKWYLRQLRKDGPLLANVLVSELTVMPGVLDQS